MTYIKQDTTRTKPTKSSGNSYHQIGVDGWNIVVGLGGLVEITNQANKIIKEYMDKLDEEG